MAVHAGEELATLDTDPADWAPVIDAAAGWRAGDDDELVARAAELSALLPQSVTEALAAQRGAPGASGALLVHGAPTGTLPPTPAAPGAPRRKDHLSETILLAVGISLGEPVGYLQEHRGALVQDLVPTRDGARRQTSTSSTVELEFHTETAFHPHRPRRLLLSCLRGDPAASTLLCNLAWVLPHLTEATVATLWEPRFRTAVDESFGGGRRALIERPVAVLSGEPTHPTLLFDADLMSGIDAEADDALDELRRVARARRRGIVLEAGDLLVVDNHACIHGRSAFAARHDGTDRWVQRSFVVEDLAASAEQRRGRIITTRFDLPTAA